MTMQIAAELASRSNEGPGTMLDAAGKVFVTGNIRSHTVEDGHNPAVLPLWRQVAAPPGGTLAS